MEPNKTLINDLNAKIASNEDIKNMRANMECLSQLVTTKNYQNSLDFITQIKNSHTDVAMEFLTKIFKNNKEDKVKKNFYEIALEVSIANSKAHPTEVTEFILKTLRFSNIDTKTTPSQNDFAKVLKDIALNEEVDVKTRATATIFGYYNGDKRTKSMCANNARDMLTKGLIISEYERDGFILSSLTSDKLAIQNEILNHGKPGTVQTSKMILEVTNNHQVVLT
jgi:hypothetical protein